MILAIVVGIINHWKANRIAEVLVDGMGKGILSAVIVGVARAVLVVMTKGGIIDTLIHACVGLIQNLSLYASGVAMLIFQTLLNFLVPSGSGPGCGIHADYDADRGSHRYEQTDRGTDFPVWRRILQPAVADQLHGHCLRDGKNPAEQILQMADAAFWNHVRVTMRLCFRRDRDELSINSGRFGFGI